MGIQKYIESGEVMQQHFVDYIKEVKSNPFLIKDWVGKDGDQVYREKEKPLTMEGFENYLFRHGIITDVSDYFENKDNRYADFVPICRAIRKEIRRDQIEGGMAMIYNPSITQRLNGLVEKSQVDGDHTLTVKVIRGDRNKTQQSASGATEDKG